MKIVMVKRLKVIRLVMKKVLMAGQRMKARKIVMAHQKMVQKVKMHPERQITKTQLKAKVMGHRPMIVKWMVIRVMKRHRTMKQTQASILIPILIPRMANQMENNRRLTAALTVRTPTMVKLLITARIMRTTGRAMKTVMLMAVIQALMIKLLMMLTVLKMLKVLKATM